MATYGLYSHIQSNRRRSMALLMGCFFWSMCWSDAEYFLVKNFINNRDQATHASYFKKLKDAVVIEIPKLNEMAYEQVEWASVPFLTFVANKHGKGENRQLLFRVARLCQTLARQCMGRIRSREIARSVRSSGDNAGASPRRAAGPSRLLAAQLAHAVFSQLWQQQPREVSGFHSTVSPAETDGTFA